MAGIISVRRAAAEDARAIAGLINRAFIVERFFVEGDRTNTEEISARFSTGAFLLAMDADELIGSVYVELRPSRVGYIGLLAVEPAHEGQGVGRRLMDAAEEWLKGSGATLVEMTVVNLRTELFPFYALLGYTKQREVPFANTRTKLPCHFVVMTKAIGED